MAWVRRAVVGLLGVVLIVDALVAGFEPLQLVVGLVMVGLVPIDAIIDAVSRPAHDEGEIARLRQVMDERDDE